MPKGSCDPVESLHQSRLLAGTVRPLERSLHRSRISGRTFNPREHPHWIGLFLKDCNPWKLLIPEKFLKKDPCWSRSWRTVSHGRDSMERKEQQRQNVVNWLQLSTPLHCSGGGGRRIRNKVEPGKKRWREGVFSFVLISHYPTLFTIK